MSISEVQDLIGYGRVSTLDQNLDLQLDALKAAGCVEIFTEHKSGMDPKRPELEKALKRLKRGSVLVIWKLDRLGRSLRDLVAIVSRLELIGAGLRVLTAGIDTTTPAGRMVFGIFGSLAEYERELIRERCNAGRAAAKKRGRKMGPKFKLDRTHIESAKALLASGVSMRDTAKTVGVHRSTLWKALDNFDALNPDLGG
jgi:DNA invertase Pin-like site-specific DNA recombinase